MVGLAWQRRGLVAFSVSTFLTARRSKAIQVECYWSRLTYHLKNKISASNVVLVMVSHEKRIHSTCETLTLTQRIDELVPEVNDVHVVHVGGIRPLERRERVALFRRRVEVKGVHALVLSEEPTGYDRAWKGEESKAIIV